MTSAMVEINGWSICYEKFGTGSEIILLIPGSIGTGRSDFKPQLEGPHALDQQKYTFISIELPGWGRSRPPERRYDENVYINDAMIALKLMDALGYRDGFSVMGWSEGTKVALEMSKRSPFNIKCLILMSVFIKSTRNAVEPVLRIQDVNYWPNDMRSNYLPIYGPEMQQMWDGYCEYLKELCTLFPGGYCVKNLDRIQCPVLLLHSQTDPLCSLDHPLHVEKHVQNCNLHRFPKGGHNFHHYYQAEFKRIVENFLLQCNC